VNYQSSRGSCSRFIHADFNGNPAIQSYNLNEQKREAWSNSIEVEVKTDDDAGN